MRSDQNRRVPFLGGQGVAIEMNDVGLEFPGDRAQQIARELDVAPGILHPLEAQFADGRFHSFELRQLALLGGRERAAEDHEMDMAVKAAERLGELERMTPDASDGIGGHENAGRTRTFLHAAREEGCGGIRFFRSQECSCQRPAGTVVVGVHPVAAVNFEQLLT